MTSLASLLGVLMAVIQAHPLCQKVTVVETEEFSADQFFFKIRAALGDSHTLQVRIYYNLGYIDYSYQLLTDVPLLRWDNKEEFVNIVSYPHHHHDEQGKVHPSPLTGDPVGDTEIVLREISEFLAR